MIDNLSAHKVAGVRAAIEARGAILLYLPPYSPDLNPIELAFAKLKVLLRKAAARTTDKLWDAIADVLGAFTPRGMRKLSRTCGICFVLTGKCSRRVAGVGATLSPADFRRNSFCSRAKTGSGCHSRCARRCQRYGHPGAAYPAEVRALLNRARLTYLTEHLTRCLRNRVQARLNNAMSLNEPRAHLPARGYVSRARAMSQSRPTLILSHRTRLRSAENAPFRSTRLGMRILRRCRECRRIARHSRPFW